MHEYNISKNIDQEALGWSKHVGNHCDEAELLHERRMVAEEEITMKEECEAPNRKPTRHLFLRSPPPPGKLKLRKLASGDA